MRTITNNITRHNHNNYEHNVTKMINKHVRHINNYDTEIHYYNMKAANQEPESKLCGLRVRYETAIN